MYTVAMQCTQLQRNSIIAVRYIVIIFSCLRCLLPNTHFTFPIIVHEFVSVDGCCSNHTTKILPTVDTLRNTIYILTVVVKNYPKLRTENIGNIYCVKIIKFNKIFTCIICTIKQQSKNFTQHLQPYNVFIYHPH